MLDISSKIIVGNEEWCAFPDLGIPAIKARVDTGAKTSCLHAFNMKTFKRKGVVWVGFEIHPLQKNRHVCVWCEAPVVDKRLVKSSTGDSQKRHVIKTPLQIGNDCWEIEVTLTNRDSMGYRMLLGREAMNGRMLVDPAMSFCLGEVTSEAIKACYHPD